MHAEQISIFLENKSGRLAEVTRVLAAADINIRALALAETTDFGVLRLIVNDNDKARQTLKENGFTVKKTRVVAVKVPDRPGGLAAILDTLGQGAINIEYMYAFVQQSGSDAIMIFRFDDPDAALQLLQAKGMTVIAGETLSQL
ncbi:MAG: ACT domain-containing protein [Desulfobacterales bacterium]